MTNQTLSPILKKSMKKILVIAILASFAINVNAGSLVAGSCKSQAKAAESVAKAHLAGWDDQRIDQFFKIDGKDYKDLYGTHKMRYEQIYLYREERKESGNQMSEKEFGQMWYILCQEGHGTKN